MRVCRIEGSGSDIYFDGRRCASYDDAYRLFRAKYNASLGKVASRRLGRTRQRRERVNGYGVVFEEGKSRYLSSAFGGYPRVRAYMLGLVDICYCRIIGCHDFADVPDEHIDDYLDWAMSSEHNLKLYDRKRTPNTRTNYIHNTR